MGKKEIMATISLLMFHFLYHLYQCYMKQQMEGSRVSNESRTEIQEKQYVRGGGW